MTTPDKWIILKFTKSSGEITYKVFANWAGGYLDGDRWRLNSGIERIEEIDDHYLIYGYSGSCYKCRKNSWGTTSYGASLISEWLNTQEENDFEIEACEKEIIRELATNGNF